MVLSTIFEGTTRPAYSSLVALVSAYQFVYKHLCCSKVVLRETSVLFALSFKDSVLPLHLWLAGAELRVLRSVYIWQYGTSPVGELLTVVPHSHLFCFE